MPTYTEMTGYAVRTYKEFREIVKNNIARITHVSFGSDLNDMDDPTQTALTCAYGMGMIGRL